MATVIPSQDNAWNVWGTQQVTAVKSVLMGIMGMQWLRKAVVVSYYYCSQNLKNTKMWCTCSRMDGEICTFADEMVNLPSCELASAGWKLWGWVSLRKECIMLGSDTSYSWNLRACLTLSLQWAAVDISYFWTLHTGLEETNFSNVSIHRSDFFIF